MAVYQGKRAIWLAERFGASTELVEMRIKTLNLWEQYKVVNLEEVEA